MTNTIAVAVHAGAGFDPARYSAAATEEHRCGLAAAIALARTILELGAPALDAVETAVRAMEDNPLFSAGVGAAFNAAGTHELDAAIMDGRTKRGGAVAGLTTVKNPISLARLVMSETPHVLLAGRGAEQFADLMRERPGIERVPNEHFATEHQRRRWREVIEAEQSGAVEPGRGTVGCVAVDHAGNLAAATSTGGTMNKRHGRVGDSPILGAGTYADNATCAVSCTGVGEYFILNCAAFHVSALMAYGGLPVGAAARRVICDVLPPDSGGLIAIDRQGNIAMPMNTRGMWRAALGRDGKITFDDVP